MLLLLISLICFPVPKLVPEITQNLLKYLLNRGREKGGDEEVGAGKKETEKGIWRRVLSPGMSFGSCFFEYVT